MFGNEKLAGFNYKGFTYSYDLDHEDDNCKTNHFATDQFGESHDIDWSPYDNPTEDDFKLWIDLGRPERIGYGPLRRKDLDYIRSAGWVTFTVRLCMIGTGTIRHRRVTAGSIEQVMDLMKKTYGANFVIDSIRQESKG